MQLPLRGEYPRGRDAHPGFPQRGEERGKRPGVEPHIRVQDQDGPGRRGLADAAVDATGVADIGRAHDAACSQRRHQLGGPVDRPVIDHDDVGREAVEGPRQGVKEIADDGSAVVGDDHDRDVGQDGGRPGKR